jgi:hypothetical protein
MLHSWDRISNFQIDTRVAPVIGRVGPSKKKKKKKKALSHQNVSMETTVLSANKKTGLYDIWGAGDGVKVASKWANIQLISMQNLSLMSFLRITYELDLLVSSFPRSVKVFIHLMPDEIIN